jgi:hypothetical protein
MTQRMGDGQPRPFDWLKQQSSSFSNSFKYDFPAAKINFKNIWYRSLKIRNKWNITLWFLLENIDGQQSLIRKKRVCAGSTYKYSPHPLHPLEPPPPLVGERGGEKRIDEERGAWPLPSCLFGRKKNAGLYMYSLQTCMQLKNSNAVRIRFFWLIIAGRY